MPDATGKIGQDEISIEILHPRHDLSHFVSYEEELVHFLQEDALHNQLQKLSLTFLWSYEGRLVGYVTLLNDKINLEGNLKEFFQEKDVHYQSVPALKIGRLCVHDDYHWRGLGTLMVKFAIQQANDISSSKSGCRYITLDAKRNAATGLDSIPFYNKLGFKMLKERRRETTPMYLDLKIPLHET